MYNNANLLYYEYVAKHTTPHHSQVSAALSSDFFSVGSTSLPVLQQNPSADGGGWGPPTTVGRMSVILSIQSAVGPTFVHH
mmetsp:Transcript_10065/g.28221  ORF Transcript_10065/g.28221 Transcript_10065/m.28221 type:complete len:81 (-) Transcript_10065:1321-1563(-)